MESLFIKLPGTQITDADRSKVFVDNTDQGYIAFNRKFTYLGSIITKDLDDSTEIKAMIEKANGILHSLNNLWRSNGLSLNMKKHFFIATIINILLWGCESLTLRATDLKKLVRKRLDNIAMLQGEMIGLVRERGQATRHGPIKTFAHYVDQQTKKELRPETHLERQKCRNNQPHVDL
jgi:hypothetical protein